jgi:hypothetical protein
MTPDLIDTRVLGAVRFVDGATQQQISDGLAVDSTQGGFRRNGSGLWVILTAAGLEAHTIAFDAPPAAPPVASVPMTLTVADQSGRYLPRAATLMLPRDPTPANADQPASLFQAVNVILYPSPTAPVSPGWAVIRAHVQNKATQAPLQGALLRVLRTPDSQVLARGVSDDRGEALIAVPGIPVTTFSSGAGGPALATEIDVSVEASFDKDAGPVIDPDAVEAKAGLPKVTSPQKLAAGRQLPITMEITLA